MRGLIRPPPHPPLSPNRGVACLACAGRHGIISSGADGQVCCLNLSRGDVKRRFRGSKHAVTGAAAAPDGSKLLLGGSTLALWDLEEGARIQKFTGHTVSCSGV
jgi:WD40 repeat protein